MLFPITLPICFRLIYSHPAWQLDDPGQMSSHFEEAAVLRSTIPSMQEAGTWHKPNSKRENLGLKNTEEWMPF